MIPKSNTIGRSSGGTSSESGVRCIPHLSCVLCAVQLHHTRKVIICHWWEIRPHRPDFATALWGCGDMHQRLLTNLTPNRAPAAACEGCTGAGASLRYDRFNLLNA